MDRTTLTHSTRMIGILIRLLSGQVEAGQTALRVDHIVVSRLASMSKALVGTTHEPLGFVAWAVEQTGDLALIFTHHPRDPQGINAYHPTDLVLAYAHYVQGVLEDALEMQGVLEVQEPDYLVLARR